MFEGPHGSGKTTQSKLLKNYLDKQGIPTIYTKEPYLEELKRIIDKYSFVEDEISPYMLLYLHAADRFAHVEYIKKKIEDGNVVIGDRYLLSSCVYQQIQGIPLNLIEQTNFFCVEPDITFVLIAPLSERKKRLNENNRLRGTLFFKEKNMELEEQLYRNIFDRYKFKWKNMFLIDGTADINETHKEIITLVERL
ncbi:MAG: dTMP kinase [Candidatus Aenigmatarchaeota archaeon]